MIKVQDRHGSTRFAYCEDCGKLMLFQGGYAQPHDCQKVIAERRQSPRKERHP